MLSLLHTGVSFEESEMNVASGSQEPEAIRNEHIEEPGSGVPDEDLAPTLPVSPYSDSEASQADGKHYLKSACILVS
jgi:hypothetical protein